MTVSPFLNSDSGAKSLGRLIVIPCELVRGTEDQVLKELIPSVRQESVALDLSNVERIDAAGIAVLITLYCNAIEAGKEFRVVDPSPRVLEMLRIVGLESILVADSDPATEDPLPQASLAAA